MAYGINVYKSNGALKLSTTDRIVRYYAVTQYTGAWNSYSIQNRPTELTNSTDWSVVGTFVGDQGFSEQCYINEDYAGNRAHVFVPPSMAGGAKLVTLRWFGF